MAKIRNNPNFKELPEDSAGYAALATILMQKILSGEYAPGQKLEGARSLADQYGVGRRVAVSALDLLTVKGFLHSEARRGFFVSEEIRPGKSYKLGIFLSGIQPFHCGELLAATHDMTLEYRYDLVYGNDNEEGCTLKRWLEKNRNIDGLLVYGTLTNHFLKPLLSWKKPHLLIGCYDVNPIHPYADGNFEELFTEKITEKLLPFAGKRFATLLGDKDSASDQVLMRAVRKAAREAGCVTDDSMLLHANGNGGALIRHLFQKKKPDVFYTLGLFLMAAAKFIRENPQQERPYIIGQAPIHMPPDLSPVANTYLNMENFDQRMARDAVTKIMKLIEHNNHFNNEKNHACSAGMIVS